MTRLYCPECSEYLEGGDGECHDCSCGWKQAVDDQCFSGELDALKAENAALQKENAELKEINESLHRSSKFTYENQKSEIESLRKQVEILQRPLDDEIISRIVCLVKNIPDEELALNVFESVRNMTNWNKSTPAEFLVLFDQTSASKNGE